MDLWRVHVANGWGRAKIGGNGKRKLLLAHTDGEAISEQQASRCGQQIR
jgi:hypothetical protein